eukprot:3319654-Lingulodinium_polyedra.AAC.1
MMLGGTEAIGRTQPLREPVRVVGVCPQDASGHAGCRGERYDQRADKLVEAFLDVGVAASKWGA